MNKQAFPKQVYIQKVDIAASTCRPTIAESFPASPRNVMDMPQ